ncbi:MAG TPA: hypothetical protein PLO67_13030 [Saprospiraceae bacterium]|nr:hypothetical protein [Saprospiraceae bacterium]HPI06781.1 hypothetical protein [Saprospiraceae bacterium]
MNRFMFCCLWSIAAFASSAQPFPEQLKLKLSDGTSLVLCRQMSISRSTPVYFYLPVNLRVSEENGNKEFLFMPYKNNDTGAIQGAILHLLIQWGLTGAQLEEAEQFLATYVDTAATIGGSVFLEPDPAHPDVEIVFRQNPLGEILLRSMKNVPKTALNAGSKMAFSFGLDAEDARVFNDAMKDAIHFKNIRFKVYFKLNTRLYGGDLSDNFFIESDFSKWLQQ